MLKNNYTPLSGTLACYRDPDTNIYRDVKVIKVLKRAKKSEIYHDDLGIRKVLIAELTTPMNPDVNVRFKYYDKMLRMALTKKLTSLVVVGKGGIGKSFQAKQQILALELEKEEDYKIIKGYSTSRALYDALFNHNGKVIIFDDCDSVLKDSNSLNILKSVLDSNTDREVSWLSAGGKSSIPNEFTFTGTVIFLSNRAKEDFDQTILSRAVMIDLHMTPDELIDRMYKVMDYLDVGKSLTKREKRKIINLLRTYKDTVFDLNMRTLRKSLTVFEESKDIDLVKYQILNG